MSAHLSDRDLLLLLDGESHDERFLWHLDHCEDCRERSDQLAAASAEFDMDYKLLAVPRMRLPPMRRNHWAWKTIAAAAVIGIGLRFGLPPESTGGAFAPVPRLTPGATRPISKTAICSESVELRRVASDVAAKVFRRYGIQSPPPKTYEIDYLIPPDLGGSEDARNLWPQPYTRGVWNARVKDALEDRLRSLVCDGTLDLATAQRELAHDWIGAYKRYFRTEQPLLDHVAFYKDRPWE